MKKTVTLNSVAVEAGVSRATASLVLRNSPLVSVETRARVISAMDKLGYIYNRGAANLRGQKTGTIGLVLCDIGSPFYSQLMLGIDEVIVDANIVAILVNSAENPARQLRQIRRLREHGVDGLILCPAAGSSDALLSEIEPLHLPCIQVLRHVSQRNGDYVGPDYADGISLAVKHLIRHGRRKIVFLGGRPIHSAARERLDGFRKTLRKHKLEHDLIVPTNLENLSDLGSFPDLMACSSPPDAVICYNDMLAQSVMGYLLAREKIPGQDIAVIGADDLPQSAVSFPTLTTIVTDPVGVGRNAARLLLDRIDNPTTSSMRILVSGHLTVRQSCGGHLP
ncbi:LacI family DNA-binding transcriptional regulator [Gluconobacter sp. Dm-62]|uniref:LacI family DNA-binding transcriptional regulator n=1 Tax=Gluconobacter sp. Dm-62 TaxID=2799804 RepID=UPI001B8D4206|nr:LacI family DNA-binding transcriptional regulator [Gluconobacter sp. Dm-62]MBS1102822.1 LacI family DNA-binding transcriptional regulator [Gluconobacter sp. Dm-62]